MNRLFEGGKIGVFIDGYGPGIEKRRGGDVSVITVNMRVQPFDAKLASALDEGVGGDSNIKATIFNLSTGEPKKRFTRHDFKLDLDRQTLEMYASPDTEVCRVALAQAKISGCYVRTEKDIAALAFCFKATFGPVGRDELELIHSLHRSQTFITFLRSEPLLDADAEDAATTDADVKARKPAGQLLDQVHDSAMGESAATKDAKRSKGVRQRLHTHHAGKKRKRTGGDSAHA